MVGRMRWIQRRALVLAVAAAGVVAIAGTALAGHQTSGVKSYTGCLVSGDGVMVKIKEGNSPRSACTGGQVEAHFSGGDITEISVGSGLTLPNGGDDGRVRIELASGQTLPSGCAAGRVVEWSGSAWVCGVDNDTTYAAGTGLDLDISETPDEFSIEPGYRLPGKACSAAGEFARGFSSSGDIQCAAPSSSGIDVLQKTASSMSLPKGEGVDLITMPVQAGTYLVTAVATLWDGGGDFNDEEISVRCVLRNSAFGELPVHEGRVDIGEETGLDGPAGNAVVHGAVAFTNPDSIRFTCTSDGGDDEPDTARNATLTAIKVGTVRTP